LERYDDLKFWGYFVIFLGLGTSLKLFFKFQGPHVEMVDCWLITEKYKDLSIKFLQKTRILNKNCKGNLVDSVHGPWTMPGARSTVDHKVVRTRWLSECGSALAEARSPATSRHGSSSVGVEKGEGNEGDSFRASLRLGRRCGDWATMVKWRWGRSSSGVTLDLEGRKRTVVVGVVEDGEGLHLL
jgi:hypothetical protein